MNIFYFNKNPEICAKQHCDKHCVKMIVEYAQLLSTAHRVLDGKMETVLSTTLRKCKKYILNNKEMDENLYKATHVNHPSSKWVRYSNNNYLWLYNLWINLLKEYENRYNKQHASLRLKEYLRAIPLNIPILDFIYPFRAMPNEFKLNKNEMNYCEKSYQLYFNASKRHIAKWKHEIIPEWFNVNANI